MATVQTLQHCTTGPDIGISPALYRCISPNCLFRCPHSGTRQHTWATGVLVKHLDQKQFFFFSKILCCYYFCILRSLSWLSGLNHTSHLVCLLGKGKPTTRTHIGLFMKYYNFTNFRETSHNSRFTSTTK